MRRWLRFNAVGIAGFAVQMAVLAELLRAGLGAVPATALSVEAAVLHNFFWHRRWTFRAPRAVLPALLRFHVLNGAVSLAGNTLLAWLFVASGVSPFAAGVLAVGLCSIVNFLLAGRFVFTGEASAARWQRLS